MRANTQNYQLIEPKFNLCIFCNEYVTEYRGGFINVLSPCFGQGRRTRLLGQPIRPAVFTVFTLKFTILLVCDAYMSLRGPRHGEKHFY